MAKQFLDASGLNQYTQALKNGTLIVGKAQDASTAFYASHADATGLIGVVPLANLPAGALERLVTVADDTARFALKEDDVQLGDTVKVTSTGMMYLVVDVAHLDSEAGYVEYTAGRAAFAQDASHADVATKAVDASNAVNAQHASSADSVEWANVQNKPTEFTPSLHTQDGSTITALTGYKEAETAGDVSVSDSLLVALGKIEKKADDAAEAAGDHVQDASTINMTGYTVAANYTAVVSSDTALTAIEKVEKKAIDSSNTADWDSITNVPSEFIPANHDAAKVTSISGYSTTGVTGDVEETDDLKTAIAKVEVKANAGADQPIPSATISSIIDGSF